MQRDITEEKKAQEALRTSEERYRELVENMAEGLTMADADMSFEFASPAAERLFGWGEGEVLGRRNPIVPPDRSDEFLEHLEVLLDGGAFMQKTISRQRKDGLNIRVTLSAAPLLDDDGRIKGVMAVLGRVCGRQHGE